MWIFRFYFDAKQNCVICELNFYNIFPFLIQKKNIKLIFRLIVWTLHKLKLLLVSVRLATRSFSCHWTVNFFSILQVTWLRWAAVCCLWDFLLLKFNSSIISEYWFLYFLERFEKYQWFPIHIFFYRIQGSFIKFKFVYQNRIRIMFKIFFYYTLK